MPGKKFFWDADNCGHWVYQVKCVSKFWEPTFTNVDGLGGRNREGPWPTRRRKVVCSTRIYSVL